MSEMNVLLRRLLSLRLHPRLLPSVTPPSPLAARPPPLSLLTAAIRPCHRTFHCVARPPGFSSLKGLSLTHSQLWSPVVASPQLGSPLQAVPTRGIVKYSKRGKNKSVKAVMKRFHRTGSGKLKYWPAGKVHNMLCKSRNHRQSLRKPRYATKRQLKTLNKMIAGW